jgi:hypothetical protein
MRVQELKCFNGVGGAIRAQIFRDDDKGSYFNVTTDARGKVVELFSYPIAWGIWTCRESLMSSDIKAAGRVTNAYDATPPEGIAAVLSIMHDLESAEATRHVSARELWLKAYRQCRFQARVARV